MAPLPIRATLAVGALLVALPSVSRGDFTKPHPNVTISGDLRLRYEWDWDSHTAAGVPRTDRDRARVRARAGVAWKLSDTLSFGARARTGNRDSQQSPHLTFHGSDDVTDDLEASFDRYFLQLKDGGFTGWLGRNSTPFWQQNEMWWDEDVTATGLAVQHEAKLTHGSLGVTGGIFALPDGMTHLHGNLAGAQLRYTRPVQANQLIIAGGLYRFTGEQGAKNLRNRNGERDYLLGVLSAQWSTKLANGAPLALGVDLLHNFEDYSTADAAPFAARHRDETDGFVLSAIYGQTKQPKDWQLGWYYGHIETFAVNASFAQDDWARFGSATQSDLSDIKGHELRATYVLTKSMNVQARYFIVDAITSVQDGQRLRLDLNWRF